MNLNLMCSL